MMNQVQHISIVALFLLSGCASQGGAYSQQQRCENLHKTFPDIVDCLKTAVTSGNINNLHVYDSAGIIDLHGLMYGKKNDRRSSHLQLYLLRAEQLSKQVKEGKISDLDARVELQKLYVQLSDRANANAGPPPGSQNSNEGMSFMCKDAISRGDRGGIHAFCN